MEVGPIAKPWGAQALFISYGKAALGAVLPSASAVWSLKPMSGIGEGKIC